MVTTAKEIYKRIEVNPYEKIQPMSTQSTPSESAKVNNGQSAIKMSTGGGSKDKSKETTPERIEVQNLQNTVIAKKLSPGETAKTNKWRTSEVTSTSGIRTVIAGRPNIKQAQAEQILTIAKREGPIQIQETNDGIQVYTERKQETSTPNKTDMYSLSEPIVNKEYKEYYESLSPTEKLALAREERATLKTMQELELSSPGATKTLEERRMLAAFKASQTGEEIPVRAGQTFLYSAFGIKPSGKESFFVRTEDAIEATLPSEQVFKESKIIKILRGKENEGKSFYDAGLQRRDVIGLGSYFIPAYGQAKFIGDIADSAVQKRYGEAVLLASIPGVVTGTIKGVKIDIIKKGATAVKERVKEFDLSRLEGLGLNKAGKVRLSKGELKFRSQTGYTKSQIMSGERAAQKGFTTQTFTPKQLMKDKELQGRVAQFSYPETIREFKKLQIIKEPQKVLLTKTEVKTSGGEVVKYNQEQTLPRQEFLYLKNKNINYLAKRTGEEFNSVVLQEKFSPFTISSSKQKGIVRTTKTIGWDIKSPSGETILMQRGKLKVKMDISKKPKLEVPNAFTPKQKTILKPIDLISNVNKKGEEIFVRTDEPLKQVQARGFRNEKIRTELFARIKAKRESQLKSLEVIRRQETLPVISNRYNQPVYYNNYNQPLNKFEAKAQADQKMNENIFTKLLSKKRTPKIIVTEEISYIPTAPVGQITDTRTKTFTLPDIKMKPQLEYKIDNQLIKQPIQKIQLEKVLEGKALQKTELLGTLKKESLYGLSLIRGGKTRSKILYGLGLELEAKPELSLVQDLVQEQKIKQQQILEQKQSLKNTQELYLKSIQKQENKYASKYASKSSATYDLFRERLLRAKNTYKLEESLKVPKVKVPFLKDSTTTKEETSKKKTLLEGFQAFIKRKGKFEAISPITSKESALDIGALKAKQTLAATFKVEKVQGTPTQIRTSGEFKRFQEEFRSYKIKKGTPIKLHDEYIQKEKYRLGTKMEIRAIQKAKKIKFV
jgi:hypothetical protein